MSLQKNFPRERKFYFWAIFLSHLVSSDINSSEADKKLFGTLAYRMISKAAADVPANPVSCLSMIYLWHALCFYLAIQRLNELTREYRMNC